MDHIALYFYQFWECEHFLSLNFLSDGRSDKELEDKNDVRSVLHGGAGDHDHPAYTEFIGDHTIAW